MAGPIIEPANLFFIFLIFLLYFFGRNNNRAGIFSILFLKQRRHSRQNVHSDDSILGRFRPPHAGSHHHSMGRKLRPPGARVRIPLQRPSMRRRDYHGGNYICVLQIEPTSEQVSQTVLQVSQTVLQVSQTVLQVSQTVLRWRWQHEWTENVCC